LEIQALGGTRIMREVAIIGVGMHPWGVFPEKTFDDLAIDATLKALKDAKIPWRKIEAIAAGIHGWSGSPGLVPGNVLASELGETGIPIINVYNACATSGSALREAYMMIASEMCDTALVVGAEKTPGGFFPALPRLADAKKFDYWALRFKAVGATNPVYWALDCTRRMKECGTTEKHLAMVKVKNSKNGSLNPNARFRKVFSIEDVLNSPMVCDPLRLYDIAATSDGGAALIVCALDKAKKFTDKPIRIDACTLASSQFGDPTARIPVLSCVAKSKAKAPLVSESVQAVKLAYKQAGIGPEDLDLIELPDLSCWHELVYTECVLQLDQGDADRMLEKGESEIGGRIPICPSGGVSSFGEAVSTQGLAQACELVWQLRGQAGERQVKDPKIGLGQVYGAQGNNSCVILSKP
jgi:acetyl-CoA acetyltransferase